MNQIKVQRIFSKNDLDYSTVDVTTRNKGWGRELSPMYMRERQHIYGDLYAMNFENLWQYCKVYPEHVDEYGEPTEAYWKWAKDGWSKTEAVRYPIGKGAKPLYSLFEGEKLGYVEARKRIYAKLYAREAVKLKAYRYLKYEFEKGRRIALKDFDAYDYIKRGMTLEEVLEEPKMKMGHAFVLAMMIEGNLVQDETGVFVFKF